MNPTFSVLAFDIRALSQSLSVSTRKIQAMVAEGTFPPPIRLGTTCRWPVATIVQFLEQQAAVAQSSLPSANQAVLPPGPPKRGRPNRVEIEQAAALGLAVGQLRAAQRANLAKEANDA